MSSTVLRRAIPGNGASGVATTRAPPRPPPVQAGYALVRLAEAMHTTR